MDSNFYGHSLIMADYDWMSVENALKTHSIKVRDVKHFIEWNKHFNPQA